MVLTKLQIRNTGIFFIAASAVFVGIGSAKSQIEELFTGLPQYWAACLVTAGVVLVISGVVCWIFSQTTIIGNWGDYECHRARRKDLKSVHELAKKFFGEDVSTLESMVEWHKKNPSVFFVIIREKAKSFETKKQLLGYYCIIPLTTDGEEKIKTGEIKGNNIPSTVIARSKRECAAIYFGGIAASRGKARAALLAVVHKEFSTKNRRWSNVFYTRPITKDGVRIAMKKGFAALDLQNNEKTGVIYKLEL